MFSNISRRAFLRLSLASIFSAILGKFTSASAGAIIDDIYYPRQLITENSNYSRTIMWHSKNLHKKFDVVLKSGSGEETIHMARCHFFTDDGEKIFVYRVQLDNLQPNTQYVYQIRQDEAVTPWYQLKTSGNISIKALIFPDSQCSDGYVTWRNIATSGFTANPDTNLFINMGDLVDNGEAGYQWRQWFNAIAAFMPDRIFAPVMGNHETYNVNWKCRLPKAYLNYFALPNNLSKKFSGYYYSFDYGPVHFISLNTQFEEIDPIRSGLVPEQLEWLKRDIANSGKPWKVVLMHKDVINYDNLDSNAPLADIDVVGKTFMPVFDELKIDLVLTAHQHTYRRHDHIFNFEPSDKGPIYIDTGVAGNCYYDVPRTKRFDKVMLPQPERGNYLVLEGNESSLTVQCFLPNGKMMDMCVLNNKK